MSIDYYGLSDFYGNIAIAPRRFNPEGKSWLPVPHTTRETGHFTAPFSNAMAREIKPHARLDSLILLRRSSRGKPTYGCYRAAWPPDGTSGNVRAGGVRVPDILRDVGDIGCWLACFGAVVRERLDPDRIIVRLYTRSEPALRLFSSTWRDEK